MRGSDGAALAGDLPVSSPADGSAWLAEARAKLTYPVVRWCGTTYGVMERVPGGWMMSGMERTSPQDARDSLGWWFRGMARDHAALRAEYLRGAARLDRARPDELTVAGRVFRVVRADRFCRLGRDGPEPPRPGDPDALPEPRTRRDARRFDHGLLPAARVPGSTALLGERWEHIPAGPEIAPEVTRDACRALTTHPGIARLRTRFAVAERAGGAWPAQGPFLHSPAAVRDHLAAYFDLVVPLMPGSSPAALTAYRRAANLLRNGIPCAEISVLGRLFRVIRVEYVVRCGPDGPEPPRPSEQDVEEPVTGEIDDDR
ncbi:DUF5954 family protein [Actinomadura formosensis]|uniref:DUF5954 family protein n=1 Tax=Actinomadura formosensis TaxID=60706 RepID=UPI0008305AA9|nr:DUF5954 family protein [Actinomadura formosensis]